MITIDDVRGAQNRIRDRVRITPVTEVSITTKAGPRAAVLKLEHLQIGGSFKARGMFNAVLHAQESGAFSSAGIVLASGGNAGIAAAAAGLVAGVTTRVYVPVSAPPAKVARLHAYGATVIEGAPSHAETQRLAAEYAESSGALLLHPYDVDDVVAGAGTVALEVGEQIPTPHSIAVAVGGGGLIGGVAVVGRDQGFPIIGVEPVGAPTLNAALKNGRPVPVDVDSRAADSLGAPLLGSIAFSICSSVDVTSLLVTDDQLTTARRYLWDEFRLVVELAAAAPVAAFQADPDAFGTGATPVLVLCGANTTLATVGAEVDYVP